LKTTSANIKLITKFRTKEYDVSSSVDERMFAFWMEFFISATEDSYSSTRFPVSLLLHQLYQSPLYKRLNHARVPFLL